MNRVTYFLSLFLLFLCNACSQEVVTPEKEQEKPAYIFEVIDHGTQLEINYCYSASPGYEIRYGKTLDEVCQDRTPRMNDNNILYGCNAMMLTQNDIVYVRVTSKDGKVDETAGPFY